MDEKNVSAANGDDREVKRFGNGEGLEDAVRNKTAAGEISEFAVVAEGEERTTWFVWILVCCCTISGLLFGVYFDWSYRCGARADYIIVRLKVMILV